MDEEEIALPRYVLDGGGPGADPIYRVAPCIAANIDRIHAVMMSCDALASVASDGHDSALTGVVSILGDAANELYSAMRVLSDRIGNAPDTKG